MFGMWAAKKPVAQSEAGNPPPEKTEIDRLREQQAIMEGWLPPLIVAMQAASEAGDHEHGKALSKKLDELEFALKVNARQQREVESGVPKYVRVA